MICFGLTEPENGSDATGLKSKAEKAVINGQEGYVITGKKRWIGNAGFSDYIIIWARVDTKIQGFLVSNPSKGLSTRKIDNKMSLRMV